MGFTLAVLLATCSGPARAHQDMTRATAAMHQEKSPQRKLSLREAIHLALQRNVDIEVARVQPWIEEQRVTAARGAFDHVLYTSVSGGESIRQSSNPLDTSDLDTDSAATRTGVKRTFPFGLGYDLYFQTNRTDSNAFFTSSISPQWSEALGLDLAMPLLRGRGEEVRAADVLVARKGHEASIHRFEKNLADQVAAIQQAYWDLVFALGSLEVRKQAVVVAERLLDENRRKFERGVLAKVDVTEAEAGVATQAEGILTAENAVQTAADQLKRLVDPALLRSDVVLAPADAPQTFTTPLDEQKALQSAMAEALARRPEYRELAPQIMAQELLARRADDNLQPKLDLTAAGSASGLDDSFSGSFKDLRSGDFYEYTVGLVFEWPLEGRSARGDRSRYELERRRLELQRRSLEDQILVEVRAAVRDVKTTEKRIEATRRTRLLNQERFEGEMNRREAGLRTTFHVLDAEERLTEARTNELKALIDYNVALMNLHKAGGTLLAETGIKVEENLSPRLAR